MRVAGWILPEDLPAGIVEMVPTEPGSSDKHDKCQSGVKEPKKQLVLKAMQQSSGNYIEAAKMLGLHPNFLLRLARNPGLKGIASEAHGAHDRF
jgi:transcriptional regulator with GAF, ATPase, and Fis domain